MIQCLAKNTRNSHDAPCFSWGMTLEEDLTVSTTKLNPDFSYKAGRWEESTWNDDVRTTTTTPQPPKLLP